MLVQIQDISFHYRSNEPLFQKLSLKLLPGNIYGLLGKNGAGKSTLLKLIAGLLFTKSGRIEVGDFEPQKRSPFLLREVFLLSEEFDLPPLRVETYVERYSPFYPHFNQIHFQEYLREFQLSGYQKLDKLSYGQKKKFLLSFGLATNCTFLMLDEPTNGLDIPSKSQLRKVLANAISDERIFIISTHQARDMETLIDPVIILDEGEVVLHAYLEQISRHLTISRESGVPDPATVIYAEPALGGHTVVKENTEGYSTHINLEILFNAVLSRKEKITEIFSRQP